MYRIASK